MTPTAAAPRLGLYRSAPRPGVAPPGRRFYLALLPAGRFVRAYAPADGFDFAGYVGAVGSGLERGDERVSVGAGAVFHHLGRYAVRERRVWLEHPRATAVVGSFEVATPEFLVSPGEVYRWYQPVP